MSLVHVRRNEVLVLNSITSMIWLLLKSNLRSTLNLVALVESQRSATSLILSQIDRVQINELIHFGGFQNISPLVSVAKSLSISQWSVRASLIIICGGHIVVLNLRVRVVPHGILIYLLVGLEMSGSPWSNCVWSQRILICGDKTGICRVCRQNRRLLSLKT